MKNEITFGYHTGDYIPNIEFTDFNGNVYELYELLINKELLIVQLGVEWCSDCIRNNEKLKRYYNLLPSEIGIINIYLDFSKDDELKKASFENAKINANNYNFASFYDYNDRLATLFNVQHTPTTIFISGKGKIKAITCEMDTDKLILPNTDELIYPLSKVLYNI